jgi:hypothetical protein
MSADMCMSICVCTIFIKKYFSPTRGKLAVHTR